MDIQSMASSSVAAPAPRSVAEIPALTGIRAVAAAIVMVCHFRFALSNIFPEHSAAALSLAALGVGVDLFFILSGFIISHNYWDRFPVFDGRQYRKFLRARLARMYPVHLVTLLVALCMYVVVSRAGVATINDLGSWNLRSFIANLFLVHSWAPGDPVSWNYPAWSISCEWLAYLCFPLIARTQMHRNVKGAIAIAALGAVSVGIAYQSGYGDNLIRIAGEFTAGCMLYCVYRTVGVWRPNLLLGLAFAYALLIFGLDVSAFCVVPSFAVVIYALAANKGIMAKILSTSFFRYWGRVSYSLYMTHALVLMALGKLLPATNIFRLAAWMVICWAVGAATYHGIEEPARRWIRSREKVARPLPVRVTGERTPTLPDCGVDQDPELIGISASGPEPSHSRG